MSIRSRHERFRELTKRFAAITPDPLVACTKVDGHLLDRLHESVMVYVSRSLPGHPTITSEKKLFARFAKHRMHVKNCTPNGLLVPKRHLILEYNAVIAACANIINSLGIGDLIESWHIPFNVRYKDGKAWEENMQRKTATEHLHSDAWAGESSGSVNLIFPLLGDVGNNRVEYMAPPETFDESWLHPLPSYADGLKFAQHYRQLHIPIKRGLIYFADFAILHRTYREPNARARISIDTTFALKQPVGAGTYRHEWTAHERISHENLLHIGEKKVLVFPDTEDTIVARDGLRSATLQLRSLFEEN